MKKFLSQLSALLFTSFVSINTASAVDLCKLYWFDSLKSSLYSTNIPDPLNKNPDLSSTENEIQRISQSEQKVDLKLQNNIALKSEKSSAIDKSIENKNNMTKISGTFSAYSPTVIIGKDNLKKSKINLDCEFLSQNLIIFENLNITGKVKFSSNSKVIFRNCTINNKTTENLPQDEKTLPYKTFIVVESRSSAFFEHCEFNNDVGENDIQINSGSYGYFNNCVFTSNIKTNIYCSKYGVLQAFNCTFKDMKNLATHNALFLENKSNAYISQCHFSNICKRAITCSDSRLDCYESYFNNTDSMIVSINSSLTNVIDCKFHEFKICAIQFDIDVDFTIDGCCFKNLMETSALSGIHSANCHGKIQSCSFENISAPSICISKQNICPTTIKDCTIKDCHSTGITIKNKANPLLENISILGSKENPLIVCSNFSNPTIKNLNFDIGDTIPEIIVYDFANLKVSIPSSIQIIKSSKSELLPSDKIVKKLNLVSFDKGKITELDNTDTNTDFKNPQCPEIKFSTPDPTLNLRVVSFPCGHNFSKCHICGCDKSNTFTYSNKKIICKNCGNMPLKNKVFKCAECRTKIISLVKVLEEKTCLICQSADSDVIFLPCGHKCCCHNCMPENHGNANNTCYICQSKSNIVKFDIKEE